MPKNETPLQIIPLGGLGEIGKNMTVIRYGNEMVVVDAGLMFPDEEMFGIDMVIPDFSYLIENKECLKAILITHGHEDHIGAMPYVLRELDVPVYGSALTLALIDNKLKESGVKSDKLIPVDAKSVLKLSKHFSIEFFRVTHSIPGCLGLAIHTPLGLVIHTGDFKMDQTPVDGEFMDYGRLAEFGDKGVLCLMSDSTNVERPGFTRSEKEVGIVLKEVFGRCTGRIILATFASNIHRIQQVMDAAKLYKRKVAILGRSMVNVATIAAELGYLKVPEDTLIDIEEINRYNADRLVIICTGSQGEPMSALTRIANDDHKKLNILPGDTVIFSASPIPGNEKLVAKTINNLYKHGAEVVTTATDAVHASGHASREELKMMLSLVRPSFFVPGHGEFRHLVKHAHLAKEMGIAADHIFVGENGQIIELTKTKGKLSKKVTSGQILIDGLGVGDVGNAVLKERKQLSEDGIVVVVMGMNRGNMHIISGPDIMTRGFVYVKGSDQLMDLIKLKVFNVLEECEDKGIRDSMAIKTKVRDNLSKFLYEKTHRRPIVLPVVIEV